MIDFKIKGRKISNAERDYLASNGYKWCSKCKTAKLIENFSKGNSSDGLDGNCKDCVKERRLLNIDNRKQLDREYYLNNKETKIAQAREYRANNQDKVKSIRENYYLNNKDSILAKNAKYREENLDKIKESQKRYHSRNRNRRSILNSEWRRNNSDRLRSYANDRYNSDNEFRLRRVCRELVRRMFLSINTKKNMSVSDVLGYSPLQLKNHIESLFKDGMSWDNYGKWQIDHRIPICSAKTISDGIYLSRLENLQPLWAEENLIKGSKLI